MGHRLCGSGDELFFALDFTGHPIVNYDQQPSEKEPIWTYTLKKTGSKGRYFTLVDGSSRESELTFSIASDHMIIADHTDVPEELKGQGVGKALFMRPVENARRNGVTIVPLCPFVKSQFGKFPETRDVL